MLGRASAFPELKAMIAPAIIIAPAIATAADWNPREVFTCCMEALVARWEASACPIAVRYSSIKIAHAQCRRCVTCFRQPNN
jgi:hypothetical protein